MIDPNNCFVLIADGKIVLKELIVIFVNSCLELITFGIILTFDGFNIIFPNVCLVTIELGTI